MKNKKEYAAPVFLGQNIYLKPNYIVSIPEYYREGGNLRSLDFIANQENLKNNKHDGRLSKKSVQALKNAINWLCLSAKEKWLFSEEKQKNFKFKTNLITLTLPDTKEPISSTDFQKKLLNPWLTYMRQKHKLKNYVWRVEFQANGKLHAHITSDTYLQWQDIRDSWNRLMDNHGYLQLFYEKYKHKDPNSTDVHSTYNVKNIAGYIAKYLSKQGNTYTYSLKAISDQIKKATESGITESKINALIQKQNKLINKKVKPLGWKDKNAWYHHKHNFWNSPLNPRPITGRIWSCSKELSAAGKVVVHIPSDECAQELKCLMHRDIEYKEIFSAPPKNIHAQYAPDDFRNQPRKIGEVYFLKANDWFTKINGVIREAFEKTRWMISRASEDQPVLELG